MSFIKTSIHYSLANFLIMAASFISFPILTRILSTNDYGRLSYLNTVILFCGAIAKLGLQNAIIRNYTIYEKKGLLTVFNSSFIVGGGILSAITTLILYWGYCLLPTGKESIPIIIFFLIFSQSCFSYFLNICRSSEQSYAYLLISVICKYVGVIVGLALVYAIYGFLGIFIADALVTFTAVAIFLVNAIRKHQVSISSISYSLLKKSIQYGFPLSLSELSLVIINSSDRLMIAHFSSMTALGLYSVGYNLSYYLYNILQKPIFLAIIPTCIRIYDTEGIAKVTNFTTIVTRYVFLVVFPVYWGWTAIQDELITLIAGSAYQSTTTVVYIVLPAFLLFSTLPILNVGYYIFNKTKTLTAITSFGALVNIILNYYLIPSYGIVGAAWATSISFIFIYFTSLFFQRSFFSIKIATVIYRYFFCALLMYVLVKNFTSDFHIAIRIISGFLFYSTLVLLVDSQLRKDVFTLLNKCKGKKE